MQKLRKIIAWMIGIQPAIFQLVIWGRQYWWNWRCLCLQTAVLKGAEV